MCLGICLNSSSFFSLGALVPGIIRKSKSCILFILVVYLEICKSSYKEQCIDVVCRHNRFQARLLGRCKV